MQPGGVEPPTYRSVVCRSIQLSYGCTFPTCGGGIVGHPAPGCNPRSVNPKPAGLIPARRSSRFQAAAPRPARPSSPHRRNSEPDAGAPRDWLLEHRRGRPTWHATCHRSLRRRSDAYGTLPKLRRGSDAYGRNPKLRWRSEDYGVAPMLATALRSFGEDPMLTASLRSFGGAPKLTAALRSFGGAPMLTVGIRCLRRDTEAYGGPPRGLS